MVRGPTKRNRRRLDALRGSERLNPAMTRLKLGAYAAEVRRRNGPVGGSIRPARSNSVT